jgi:hypothetical protein
MTFIYILLLILCLYLHVGVGCWTLYCVTLVLHIIVCLTK